MEDQKGEDGGIVLGYDELGAFAEGRWFDVAEEMNGTCHVDRLSSLVREGATKNNAWRAITSGWAGMTT